MTVLLKSVRNYGNVCLSHKQGHNPLRLVLGRLNEGAHVTLLLLRSLERLALRCNGSSTRIGRVHRYNPCTFRNACAVIGY